MKNGPSRVRVTVRHIFVELTAADLRLASPLRIPLVADRRDINYTSSRSGSDAARVYTGTRRALQHLVGIAVGTK